jgi:peptidoglycan glycosyltransferase
VSFFERNTPVLAQVGIGQNAVRSTPLQMALVAAAVANGGEVMTPHVMREVRDRDNRVVDTYTPRAWTRAMTTEVAATLRDAMALVVSSGTARNLSVPGVATAGKTGTAQVGDGTSHTWIIGFAPVEAPRVAIAVIVENQPGEASEATGGRIAAPIGRAVLETALQVTAETDFFAGR